MNNQDDKVRVMSECVGDGGTCGLGGYCKECPHVKDQELVEKIAKIVDDIVMMSGSISQDRFFAEIDDIRSLCRQHDMQMATEAVESNRIGTNKDDSDADRYYDKAIDASIKAIDNLKGESDA